MLSHKDTINNIHQQELDFALQPKITNKTAGFCFACDRAGFQTPTHLHLVLSKFLFFLSFFFTGKYSEFQILRNISTKYKYKDAGVHMFSQ